LDEELNNIKISSDSVSSNNSVTNRHRGYGAWLNGVIRPEKDKDVASEKSDGFNA